MNRNISLVVIDDVDHVRHMLTSMLTLDGFDVVGAGADAAEGIALTEEHRPNVVVIDYMMPGVNGLEASRRIRALIPDQKIILYSAYLNDDLKKEAKEAGVSICVGKVEGLETLQRNIASLCLTVGKPPLRR